jgi:uncharacterized membrane protein
MVGAWYDPIIIPIVCTISLAFLIVAVVWAAYHPGWKHGPRAAGGGPSPTSVLHNRTWLDAERDLASGELTDEHEYAPGAQHEKVPAQGRHEARVKVAAGR